MSITELSVDQLTLIIEKAVEHQITKYFDEHINEGEIKPELAQLLKQQSKDFDRGETGKSYSEVLTELGLE